MLTKKGAFFYHKRRLWHVLVSLETLLVSGQRLEPFNCQYKYTLDAILRQRSSAMPVVHVCKALLCQILEGLGSLP